MKARLHSLTPELQAMVLRELDEQSKLERGFIAQQMVMLMLYVMASPPYDWGRMRLERLFEQIDSTMEELVRVYGADCWPDKIISDLKRRGLTFEDDGWMAEREANRALGAKADPAKVPVLHIDHEKVLSEMRQFVAAPAPVRRKKNGNDQQK